MTFSIDRIDHIVITVNDIEKTCRFYCDVLGMTETHYGDNRIALEFGKQKINVHPISNDITPTASKPVAGSVDICLVSDSSIDDVVNTLNHHGIPVEEGPVERQGALGKMSSVYIRDPDGNLIELCSYENPLSYIYDYV